jgi:hypothetical protein
MKTQRAKPSDEEKAVRKRVTERSGRYCELYLPGCTVVATDRAHRLGRKMGGRPRGDDWRASNVLDACRVCHQWTHDRPEEARDLGFMLLEGQDPEVEPVAYRNGGWVRLQDDGGVWPV